MSNEKMIKNTLVKCNFGVILAAGSGNRLKDYSLLPKQYINIGSKTILQHSMEKFALCKDIAHIVVIISKEHRKYYNDIYKKIISSEDELLKNNALSKIVQPIVGGKERFISSYNAIDYVIKFEQENDIIVDNIIIHDSARPFFSNQMLQKICDDLRENDAVIPVLNPYDSCKELLKYEHINNIKSDITIENITNIRNVSRDSIFLSQTPQAFDLKLIAAAFQSKIGSYNDVMNLSEDQITKIKDLYSDDLAIFCDHYNSEVDIPQSDRKVKFISGEKNNFKITDEQDLNYAIYLESF